MKRTQTHQNKPVEVRCPSCRAVSYRGHWISDEKARELTETGTKLVIESSPDLCPACQQSRDRCAMGVLEIQGERWRQKSQLVFQTIGAAEHTERTRNDQERVLWSRTLKNVTRIYVSLPELARHIGRELRRTFQGRLEYRKSADDPVLRVIWYSDLQENNY